VTKPTPDKAFLERSDALVDLANQQIPAAGRLRVGASFSHGTARFNAWLTARGVSSAEELRKVKEEALAYFTAQYRGMLTESLDDYIRNYDRYMRAPPEATQ
jgi:hypothetical protein